MPLKTSDGHRQRWAVIKAMRSLFAHKDARKEQAASLAANAALARAVRVQAMITPPKAEPKAMLNDYSFKRASSYNAQHVVQLQKLQNQAADELSELTEKADGEGLTASEEERMETVVEAADAIDAELTRMDKSRAAKVRAADMVDGIRGDQQRNRYSGLVSADEDSLDGPGAGRMSSRTNATVAFRAQDGRTIRSLSVADPFCDRASRRNDDEPRYSLGDRIAAHLGVKPFNGIQGNVWEGMDGAGGYLTGFETFGTVFDMARAASACFPAGVQVVPMSESELILVKQMSDPTAAWTPELGAVSGSAMTFGRIRLVPKKLACIVPVSLEILEDAANAGQLIQSAITNAMALELDRAILSGTGTGEQPLGIRNMADINTHSVVSAPAEDYSDLETAIEKIRLANYVGEDSALSWIRHPRDASQYNRLQDTLLQPLQPTPGAAALKKFQTTSLPITLGAGAASEMIVGDMSQVIVGMRTGATVRFLPAGTITQGGESLNAATQFATLIAVHMRADVAVIRPSWITVIDGVTWS